MYEEILHPSLTDDEIIQTFSPLEREFYAWVQDGKWDKASHDDKDPGKFDNTGKFFRVLSRDFQVFDGQHFDGQDDLIQKCGVFADKWFGKVARRFFYAMPTGELLSLIRSTSGENPDQLYKTVLKIQTNNVPDLLLGESTFGGDLTGYSVRVDPHSLYADVSGKETSNPDNSHLLDYAILVVDIDDSRYPLALPPLEGKKRRLQNSSPGENSAASGANNDGFPSDSSLRFFQIGSLMACAGEEWAKVRGEDNEEIGDADWDDTGYTVVIKLDGSGYPTGPVFAIYGFQQRRHTNEGPIWEPMEWQDNKDQELPHIRRLYPACEQKFFLAQIADRLEDLKKGSSFNFDVVTAQKCPIARATLTETDGKIVPNYVPDNTCDTAVKRPRIDDLVGIP
ncbi:hypothetical protein EDB81DRAFT_950905 [Dactylonectria macrodidyma]|uniref:Uncharacterized protein n=1 Tax=Dactylonectria macrodidyma TaxID=307937 RepID=A0A9P9DZF1_9HYPO|nr:hypothetical protein EDB81DRAFT_950905 [Dactylonectria macrodidyma]